MLLEIEAHKRSSCGLAVFKINEIPADLDDFIKQFNTAMEPGTCLIEKEIVKSKPAVLRKYKITTDEFEMIASMVDAKLMSGECNFCE